MVEKYSLGGVKSCILEDFASCNTTPLKNKYASFVLHYIKDRGFKYVVWLRLSNLRCKPLSIIAKVIHRHLSTKYGIQIPASIPIGKGFRINHGVGLVMNENTIIGEHVCFHQFTTVGTWKHKAATIGNNVMIGPGVNIVDDIIIGNNVVIGAGSVVVKDVPDNCIIAGNPARIIRQLENNAHRN